MMTHTAIPLLLSLLISAAASEVHTTTSSSADDYLQQQLREMDLPSLAELARQEFTTEDELQLLDDLLENIAAEQENNNNNNNNDEMQLYGLQQKSKRFTVDFNGMQVSYPTYVRLSRLQEKVLKLQKTIQLLHRRYTEEQLSHLPQYQRLMTLFNSLQPLLPSSEMDLQSPQDVASFMEHEDDIGGGGINKRTPFTVDFMGMRVSYPQYLRLVSLQEKVVKLDMVMRRMRARVPLEQLEQMPKWHTLVALHESLSKMLPAEYLAQYEQQQQQGESISNGGNDRKKRGAKFNDIYVSMPDFGRLMGMQRSAVKLDQVMRKMLKETDREKLLASPKWRQLVELRRSLQKLMPEGHPEFTGDEEMGKEEEETDEEKRAVTVDFNGVRVSYPEYVRLTALQKKVQKLDAVMERIRQLKRPEELESLPQWRKLVELRRSLVNLQPLLQQQQQQQQQ